MNLHLARFSLPLRAPVSTARVTHELRRGFLVRIEHDGLVAYGEATPMPSQGTEPLEACEAALQTMVRALQGLSVPPVGNLEGLLARLDAAPAARCGVEQALLDLHSQRGGVPLARLLAPRPLARVAVNALLIEPSLEALRAEAARRVAQGFRVFKVKVGTDLELESARLAAVREVIGPSSELRIDANGGWSVDAAVAALAGLAPHRLAFCEQPVATARELRALQLRTDATLAADECLARPAEQERVLAELPVLVLVLKPMVLGGLLPARRLAARAHERGLDVIVTTTLDGAVARAGATALACAIGDDRACGLATGDLLERDVAQNDPCAPQDGFCATRSEPGLGLTLDPALLWSAP